MSRHPRSSRVRRVYCNDTPGQAECVECSAGHYSVGGAAQCTPCDTGDTAPAGSTNASACTSKSQLF